jgi:Ricin-type beta-trefoil lectin domain-like
VVLSESVSTSSGSISVPFTFQSSHDAFAIYLTPTATVMPGYHKFVIGNDSLCLDVYGNVTTAGAAIDQWTCNGQGNQEFQFVPVSGGYGELQAGNSGDDVAVANSSTAAGTPDIIQQVPSGNAASLWLPVKQSDGSYEFKNDNSGLCLDVTGAVSTLGQQLDQWACKNAAGNNQDFTAS